MKSLNIFIALLCLAATANAMDTNDSTTVICRASNSNLTVQNLTVRGDQVISLTFRGKTYGQGGIPISLYANEQTPLPLYWPRDMARDCLIYSSDNYDYDYDERFFDFNVIIDDERLHIVRECLLVDLKTNGKAILSYRVVYRNGSDRLTDCDSVKSSQ
jgi:hypothetical protein